MRISESTTDSPAHIPVETMKRRRNLASTDPSVLLQLMGVSSELGFNPSMALASWKEVEGRLDSDPVEASICPPSSIFYPLKYALLNERTPCPPHIIEKLIRCFPRALSIDDFSLACRCKHTTGKVMKIILQHLPQCKHNDYVKRWEMDWVACNKNSDVALALIDCCEAANPKSIQQWRNMTHRAFWLSCLFKRKSDVVSQKSIKDKYLLQFFIKEGNVECVRIILDAYPILLETHIEPKSLPIHFALSVDCEELIYKPRHHRSEMVRLLLQKGYEKKVGGRSRYELHGLTLALNAVLDARWNDKEKIQSLQVCLQFAQAYMNDSFGPEVNTDIPLLHAALGVLPVDVLKRVMKKIGMNSLCLDKDGRTAIFALINLIVYPPVRPYIAVQEKIQEEKKRVSEHVNMLNRIRFQPQNRDMENQINERHEPNQLIYVPHETALREGDENQMNGPAWRMAQNLDPVGGNRLFSIDDFLPPNDVLESKFESEMISSLFQLLLTNEICAPTDDSDQNAAAVKDHNGRLCIHFACEIGLTYEDGLSKIINAHHQGLTEPDGLTGLFPFALAASSGDLEVTFKVLLEDPSVMLPICV